MKSLFRLIALLCLVGVLSACGNSSSTDTKGHTYQFKNASITLAQKPQRVIPLSASLLKMWTAVGGKAIARPTTQDPLSPELEALPQIGHVSNINAESLVGYHPDLVLGLENQNKKIASILDANKIPYLLLNYDGIDDNVPLLQFFGELAGTAQQTQEVVKKYNQSLQKVKQEAKSLPPLRVIVLRATGKDVTAETPKAITASMLSYLEINNVITNHLNGEPKTKTVPYSLEVLAEDDPDVILVVTMGRQEQIQERMKEVMTGNPAWQTLSAVRHGKVYYLPGDMFLLNPGIRTPEAMDYLVQILSGKQ